MPNSTGTDLPRPSWLILITGRRGRRLTLTWKLQVPSLTFLSSSCHWWGLVDSVCSLLFFLRDLKLSVLLSLSIIYSCPLLQLLALLTPVKRTTGYNSDDSWARKAADHWAGQPDRKSTRLNSSHTVISYAVFCLKKKNKTTPLLFLLNRPIFQLRPLHQDYNRLI